MSSLLAERLLGLRALTVQVRRGSEPLFTLTPAPRETLWRRGAAQRGRTYRLSRFATGHMLDERGGGPFPVRL